mgnify:CR=1 FL=1
MTDTEQIMTWLKEGEHETLDFKQTVKSPAKIAKNIVAFANKKGGIILIGVSDFGEIIGIDPEQERYIMQKAARDYCDPPVRLSFKEYHTAEATCLAVLVRPSGDDKVEALDEEGNRRVWVRYLDECVSDEEREAERQRQEQAATPVPIYTSNNEGLINYLKQHHTITIKQYQKLMDLPFHMAKKSLERLRHADILQRHRGKNYPYYSLKNT